MTGSLPIEAPLAREAEPPSVADPPGAWQVSQALVRAALEGVDDGHLVAVLGTALAAVGLVLCTIEVACDVVNAEGAHRCIRWQRGVEATDGAIRATEAFRGMLRDDVAERRLTLGGEPLTQLAADGATDAVAFAGHLEPDVTLGFFDDVMTLFATDRADGFAAREVDLLRAVMPCFTLAMGARLNAAAARALIRTYLGQDAATALLDGRVGLGDVATIRTVVLYCDLVGFTSMTDKLDPHTLIGHLNRFFATVTEPVARAGGQVAGHVGDAVVMFLPVRDTGAEGSVCAAAVEAALAGLRALEALNDPSATLAAPLRARIGIDVGDVVHGNVGSAGRFSFTIIGTAVNRATRLQALAKELGAVLLTTAEVAQAAAVPWCAFGRHALRGLDEPVEVVGLSSADQ